MASPHIAAYQAHITGQLCPFIMLRPIRAAP